MTLLLDSRQIRCRTAAGATVGVILIGIVFGPLVDRSIRFSFSFGFVRKCFNSFDGETIRKLDSFSTCLLSRRDH